MAEVGGLISLPEPACGVGEIGFEVVPLAEARISILESGGPDFVIRNQRQWCEFWRFTHSGLENPPTCDRSVADTELVIATTSVGGSTCYGIAIERIQQLPGSRDVTVFVNDINPGNGCICGAGFGRPLQAVVVAEPIARVEFVHEPKVIDCSR